MAQGRDTSIGGDSPRFPSTIWNAIEDLKSEPDSARALLVERYWKPVYAFVRLGWNASNEDAKDLTQEFFVFLIEGRALEAADPRRGRFRSFLKTVLRNFLAGEHRRKSADKRGGGTRRISLDLRPGDLDVSAPPGADPETVFDREWARALVGRCLGETRDALAAAGKAAAWTLLEAHDLATGTPPDYAQLAAAHGLSENQVKHLLQEAREALKSKLVERVREYAADEAEVGEELALLLGLWHG